MFSGYLFSLWSTIEVPLALVVMIKFCISVRGIEFDLYGGIMKQKL